MRSPRLTGRLVGALIIIVTATFIYAINTYGPKVFPLLAGPMELLIKNRSDLLTMPFFQSILSFVIVWIMFLIYPLIKGQSRVIALYFICFISIECISILFSAFLYLYIYLHAQNIIDASYQSLDSLRSVVNLTLKMMLYSTRISMATAMATALLLCYSMFQSRIVPRLLSIWGFIGNILLSALFLAGLLITTEGASKMHNLGILLFMPAILWYFIAFPFWLLIKGFNPLADKSCREDSSLLGAEGQSQPNIIHDKTPQVTQVHSLKSTGRLIGILVIITYFIVILDYSISGNLFNYPMELLAKNRIHLPIGALLQLIASLGDVWITILLYPILKKQNKSIALYYIYLTCIGIASSSVCGFAYLYTYTHLKDIIDVSIQSMDSLQNVVNIAKKIKLYTDHIDTTASLASILLLCYSMFQSRIVPIFLSVWGFAGGAFALLGVFLDIIGVVDAMSVTKALMDTPCLLWALIAFPLWLLIKGFNAPTPQPCKQAS